MTEERKFLMRPAHRPRTGPTPTYCRAFRQITAALRKLQPKAGRKWGKGWGGPSFLQRCIVRIRYAPNSAAPGLWAAHGRYIGRTQQKVKGPDGEPQPGLDGKPLFAEVARSVFNGTTEGIDAKALLGSWQAAGDPRLFKLMLSPEFGERVDLVPFTRKLMVQVEKDLNLGPLEWVGAEHVNTDNPHVHVALRGMASGQAFRIPREYVKFGIRRHAQNFVTQQIGYRTKADAIEATRRKAEQLSAEKKAYER